MISVCAKKKRICREEKSIASNVTECLELGEKKWYPLKKKQKERKKEEISASVGIRL